jgi:hypothetical protein
MKSKYLLGIVLAVGLALTAVGQAPGLRQRALPDFDVRDQNVEGAAAVEKAEAAVVVQRRNVGLAALQASPDEVQLGTRIVPNVFGLPKMFRREGHSLSGRSSLKPEETARAFLQARSGMFQLTPTEVDELRLVVEDSSDHATFLAFNQMVNGVDVFNGHLKFVINKEGEVIQVAAGDVVAGLSLSTNPRLTPVRAVQAAFAAIGDAAPTLTPTANANGKTVFLNPHGSGYTPVTAELSIFPMTALSARLAYRIFLENGPETWYELLVDADTGALLFRHNLYTFSVQANVWTQSPAVGSRTIVQFPDGWLPPNGVLTTGNNADAYLDANGDNQPDPTLNANLQNGRAFSAAQNFDFPFGDGTLGQNPRLFQPAAVTNLFYLVNTAHDYYYSLGFNEAAGSFQTDNFGRGGAGNDPVIAQAQYGGFTNNAAFAPSPDGVIGRIRMGLFTRGTSTTTDDLDSAYDGQVVIHEYGHGVSNRLVGARVSTSCLTRIQSGALGEGWSDYFAISFYNNPVNGAYLTQDAVRGIRRQSYDAYLFTYEDIGNSGYEVHNDGEIWTATLWDLRKTLGQATTDKLVLDGLKATPCNPSMTDARDAILTADQVNNAGANRTALWTVFARHGLGYSSLGVDGTVLTGSRYDAAYDLPPSAPSAQNPAITSNPLLVRVGVGDAYRYSVNASNPAGGVLSYALTSGPLGMSVDASSGAVNWTTTFTPQRVKITVTDGKGGKVVHGYALPVTTVLVSNTPVTISGLERSDGYATINVPPNTPALQLKMRGGTGDTDFLIRDPEGSIAVSTREGTTETLTFANPKSGQWMIDVYGYFTYNQVSLTASLVTPLLLPPNTRLSNLQGDETSEALYRIAVPAGATALTISTSGGTGDVDLLVRKGAPAVCQDAFVVFAPCSFDFDSAKGGNEESITINNPAPGDWYVDLYGYDSYSGVKLDILTAAPPINITLATGGSGVSATTGAAADITTGYATASVNGAAPYGTAVFSFSKDGIVVSEVGIPASPPTQTARIFVDYRTGVAAGIGAIDVYTGVALVNRGSSSASVTYTLRDRGGQVIAIGHGNLAAGAHQAKFIQELSSVAPDFGLPATFPKTTQFGSLEITSGQPVSVLALRLTPNQRGDVLLTSTPVADLSQPAATSPLYFPQIADGGGYTTSVTLLNTSAVMLAGTIALFDDSGTPLSVRSIEGGSGSTFSYSIPSGGAFVFQTDGSPGSAHTGWIKVTPNAGNAAPVGSALFSYSPAGILITESGVPAAAPTTHARVYIDKSGRHDTGIAIASPGSPADVTMTAFQNNGTALPGNNTTLVKVVSNGHKAAFAGELLSNLQDGFTGIADLTSSSPFVVLTLRFLRNTRGDSLLTTFPTADVNQPAPSPIVFPQIANGAGYTTQFIFISASASASVTLNLFGDDGLPLIVEHSP